MTALINISDTFFCCQDEQVRSDADVGYAYLEDKQQPNLGMPALANAKVQPSKINNRFWHDLSTTPIKTNCKQVRHHADLAWHQIKKHMQAMSQKDVALIVPSHYSQDSLNLLTGICQSLELSLSAVIDRSMAIAAMYGANFNDDFVVLELQQHQSLLTFIKNQDGELSVERNETLPAHGLIRLQDKCLHLLRQGFIESERFDPMHLGQTEQQLFDQLRLNEYSEKSTKIFNVQNGSKQHSFECTAKALCPSSSGLLDDIYQRIGERPLLLDHQFADYPNFPLRTNDTICTANTVFEGAKSLLDSASDRASSLTLINSVKSSAIQANLTKTKPTKPSPDHLLLNGIAYPAGNYRIITQGGALQLVKEQDNANAHIRLDSNRLMVSNASEELLINGQPASENTPLVLSDELSMLGSQSPAAILAIAVSKENAL